MTGVVLFLVLMLVLFTAITGIANRIPKTGRCFDAAGEEISAVITNINRLAEKAVTMRLKDDSGKCYRVKLKASEAKLWIKGDRVKIILSENSKNYRVLFHEYFKANEARIREHALEKLEKSVNTNFIAARLVGYTKDSPEAFRTSEADSHTVFSFATYMRMIDIYYVVAGIMSVAVAVWYLTAKPEFMEFLIPLLLVLMIFYVLSGTVKTCKRVLKKVNE